MPQGVKHTGIETRLKRIEGQVRGVERMIQERRYCIDILQQLTAIRRAVDETSLKILRGHINGCVSTAVRKGQGPKKVDELMEKSLEVLESMELYEKKLKESSDDSGSESEVDDLSKGVKERGFLKDKEIVYDKIAGNISLSEKSRKEFNDEIMESIYR